MYGLASLPTPTVIFLLPTPTPATATLDAAPPLTVNAIVPSAPAPTPMPDELTANVLAVINVSTIEVSFGGARHLVYYLGLSAPATTDACFAAGRRANAGLVENQIVRLVKDVTDVDEIGRLPRYVYVGDQLVNATLLQQGYARYVPYAPNTRFDGAFQMAATDAQAGAFGCYTESGSVTPSTLDPLVSTPLENECGRYLACSEFGTKLNFDLYVAVCPQEQPLFDAGGDGIGCNQRVDWGYPP